MIHGDKHKFSKEPVSPEWLERHHYGRDMYMPPYHLICSCGWMSEDAVHQGQGEWTTYHTYRILHLLEYLEVE